jgi:thioredoxin 1
MSNVREATDANFEELVLKNEKPVIVDFWAAWCGPCRLVAPEVEKLADKYAGNVEVVKLDVDANPHTAGHYGIMSIPTVAFFAPGSRRAPPSGSGRPSSSRVPLGWRPTPPAPSPSQTKAPASLTGGGRLSLSTEGWHRGSAAMPVSPPLLAVAACRHVAPDAAVVARTIHEEPATAGVPAPSKPIAHTRQLETRQRQRVDDGVPATSCRPQRPPRIDPRRHAGKQLVQLIGEGGIIGQGELGQAPEPTQPAEVTGVRQHRWHLDCVQCEEGTRRGRRGEVVVARLGCPYARAVVSSRPVRGIRNEQGILQRACRPNHQHRR